MKTDSLNGYTDAHGTVQLARQRRDAAPGSHAHCLAALKHAGDIDSQRDDWAQRLCNSTEYVEAIFVADVRVTSVAEIRIAAGDYQQLWNLCFQSHGRSVADGERALANDFLVLLRAHHAKRIRICEVPDA